MKHEFSGIREFLEQHPETQVYYHSLGSSENEADRLLIQLMSHHPILKLENPGQMPEVFQPGSALIVQNLDIYKAVEDRHTELRDQVPSRLEVGHWVRWMPWGRDINDASHWQVAWKDRNLKLLERQFFIVRFY